MGNHTFFHISNDCNVVGIPDDLAKQYVNSNCAVQMATDALYFGVSDELSETSKRLPEIICESYLLWSQMDPTVKMKLELLEMKYTPEVRLLIAGEILRLYG